MKLGILGGGQLARMMALAALPLGIRCKFLDPSPDAVAGHVGELLVGAYDDPKLLAELARGVDAVTFEFENVPAAAIEALAAQRVPVAPNPRALAVAQDRIAEKTMFAQLGFGVPPFAAADDERQLAEAIASIGAPCVVKTRRLGYDGKGQARVAAGSDPGTAAKQVLAELRPGLAVGAAADLIVEGFVSFDRELSVLAVRARDGEVRSYPLVENVHHRGILRRSTAPAPNVSPAVQTAAATFVKDLLRELDYVGVLAVELFLVGDRLLANEIAPRVHNSGHWTIEGSRCSQFENHVRAVLGLPLGDVAMAGGVAVMRNLIGAMPPRDAVLAVPGAHWHDYGKAPRAGRKIGHVTLVEADPKALAATLNRLPQLDADFAR